MAAGATPRVRVAEACRGRGKSSVVSQCAELLVGGDADPDLIVVLGGQPAVALLRDGFPDGEDYWLRVWAARGLLWAGPGDDVTALRRALTDESWRVREMTCKVVARHTLADLLPDVAALQSDPVARVRHAAERAVARIVDGAA